MDVLPRRHQHREPASRIQKTVTAPFVRPPPVAAHSALLQGLVEHLLIAREQLPFPLDELERQLNSYSAVVQRDGKARPQPPAVRRATKAVASVRNLCAFLGEACDFFADRLQEAVILLGSSQLNCREVYRVRFSTSVGDSGGAETSIRADPVDAGGGTPATRPIDYRRRLLRTLVTEVWSLPLPTLPCCRLHVFLAARNPCGVALVASAGLPPLPQPPPMPPCLRLVPNFRVRISKTRPQPQVCIVLSRETAATAAAEVAAAVATAAEQKATAATGAAIEAAAVLSLRAPASSPAEASNAFQSVPAIPAGSCGVRGRGGAGRGLCGETLPWWVLPGCQWYSVIGTSARVKGIRGAAGVLPLGTAAR